MAFPENEFVMRKLKSSTIATYLEETLRHGHISRGDELGPAKTKLKELLEFTTDQFLCANIDFRKFLALPSQLRALEVVVEVWLVGSVHSVLFDALAANFADEDEKLLHKILACQTVTLAQLGARPHIAEGLESLDLAPAVQLLQDRRLGLDSSTATPLEKLYLLRQVFATLSQAVLIARQRRQLLDALKPTGSPRPEAGDPTSLFALSAPLLDSPLGTGATRTKSTSCIGTGLPPLISQITKPPLTAIKNNRNTQYKTKQYNTTQYNTIQYNTKQHNIIQYLHHPFIVI